MPTRTPSNGLDTANQKETSQPESLALLFVFTLFSQALEDRYFTKREMRFGMLWRSGALAYVPALPADDCRLANGTD